MANAPELVFDLIFGRWRSQTLYAGAALGVFDQLSDQPKTAASVAEMINADPAMLYRLMRALASIGLLIENDAKAFCLTDAGALLREDHQHSLRATCVTRRRTRALCRLEASRRYGARRSPKR